MNLTDLVLTNKALPVTSLDGLVTIFTYMLKVMQEHNGVGIAAPQVGLSQRMFIYTKNNGDAELAVNPRIISRHGHMIDSKEGCLSHPNINVYVPRYPELVVSYYTMHGAHVRMELKGDEAIIFQHELDHLNGKTILSYIK